MNPSAFSVILLSNNSLLINVSNAKSTADSDANAVANAYTYADACHGPRAEIINISV